MVRIPNPKKHVRYVFPEERELPREEQTVFYLKPMTAGQVLEAADKAKAAGEDFSTKELLLSRISEHVVGSENLKMGGEDGSDQLVNLDEFPASDLPTDLVERLIEAIDEISRLKVAQVKN